MCLWVNEHTRYQVTMFKLGHILKDVFETYLKATEYILLYPDIFINENT